LAIGQIDALEKLTNLQEKLERVFFVLHIAIISHFGDKLLLNSFEIVTKNVIKNNLVKRRNKLHNGVTCALVDKSSHSSVLKILQLIAEMYRVDDDWVRDFDCLLILDFVR